MMISLPENKSLPMLIHQAKPTVFPFYPTQYSNKIRNKKKE